MAIIKTLGQITDDDFRQHPAWAVVGGYEAEDLELSPVEFDSNGRIPSSVGEVWCLCTAVFANGSEYLASAMCRGDSSEGPLLWEVSNGKRAVPLLLPPAPPFVLDREGPTVFAAQFGLSVNDVFPLTLKVVPCFATKPEKRSVKLGTSGII
jgi:hypothetical protein